MITAEGCCGRRERLWDRLDSTVDAVLVASPEHLAYLAGYSPTPFSFRTNEAWAALWLTREESCLIVDNVCRSFAEAAFVDRVEVVTWYDGKHTAPGRRNNLADAVAAWVTARAPRTLGCELAAVPAAVLARSGMRGDLVDVSGALLDMRRTKDRDELATIETCINAAEAGFAAALEAINPGRTELEIFEAVHLACVSALDGPAQIYGDFAAGPRAVGPNTLPTTHVLTPGELLVLDFSVIVKGYRCDFANTLVAGEPSQEQRDLHEACLAALDAGERLLAAGVEAKAIDEAVQGTMAKLGWTTSKRSHTGHGIGLAHPEAPYLVAESRDVLRAGDVVTIEPSMFPPSLEGGIRVEHNYVVTEGGCRRLTSHRLALTK